MADNKVSEREIRVFWTHLSIYLIINACLAALNLYSQPEKIWFIWPLIGWGIGVGAHGLALYLEAKSQTHSVLATPEARAFVSHLFVYVSVNALLAYINLSTSPENLWFYWPLLGWGLGVFLHGLLLSTQPAATAAPAVAKTSARAKPARTKSVRAKKRAPRRAR